MTNAQQSIDRTLADLKTRLAAPGSSLLPLLSIMGRFTKYSVHSQLLILAQRPDATRVQGYRAWANAGFQVRKGEKGIAIYAPMRLKQADTADADSEESTASYLRYRIAYVFDVTQVDPIPGTTVSSSEVTVATVTPAVAAALEFLKAFIAAEGTALHYEILRPGLFGYTDGRTITCREGLDAQVELATLIHEITHALLHFDRDNGCKLASDLTTREIEAESVTYILCTQLGLAESDTQASVDYIRAYRGTPETLDRSLERIRNTANRLSAALIPEPPR
jgi:antirestriction protein ArdC